MSAEPEYHIHCDWPECVDAYPTFRNTVKRAREDAQTYGWGVRRQPDQYGKRNTRRDYCPVHMDLSKTHKNPDDWSTP